MDFRFYRMLNSFPSGMPDKGPINQFRDANNKQLQKDYAPFCQIITFCSLLFPR